MNKVKYNITIGGHRNMVEHPASTRGFKRLTGITPPQITKRKTKHNGNKKQSK